MDISKLNSNERLAFWGAILSIVGTILTIVGAYIGAGGLYLTFILALAMIAILFLPTWSPQTKLPGSKGTLMLIVGGIAGIGALLGLLTLLSVIAFLGSELLFVLGLLIGIIGGLMMGWGGWQEFQAEGGKFQLGTAPSSTGAAPPPPAPSADASREPAIDASRDQASAPAPAPERTADAVVDAPAADAPRPDYRDEDRPTS